MLTQSNKYSLNQSNSNLIKCTKNKKLINAEKPKNIIENKIKDNDLNESIDSGNASVETNEINMPSLINDNFEMAPINSCPQQNNVFI